MQWLPLSLKLTLTIHKSNKYCTWFRFAWHTALKYMTENLTTVIESVIVIVITFYSPSCLGQETAKGPFGFRVKLPPAHLSTTHGRGFALSL